MFPSRVCQYSEDFHFALLKKILFDQVASRTKPVYVFEHIYAFSNWLYF